MSLVPTLNGGFLLLTSPAEVVICEGIALGQTNTLKEGTYWIGVSDIARKYNSCVQLQVSNAGGGQIYSFSNMNGYTYTDTLPTTAGCVCYIHCNDGGGVKDLGSVSVRNVTNSTTSIPIQVLWSIYRL